MREITACPACGSSGWVQVAALDDDRLVRFLSFSELKYGGLLESWLSSIPPVVLRCPACSHCWYRYQPEPEQLGYMYSKGRTLLNVVQPSREATPYMQKEMRRLWKLAGDDNIPKTFLDFGSGIGRWARAAVLEGFCVTAYEPSLERGLESGIPFQLVHSIDELSSRKFDVIQLEQVLEHVPDPLETLKQLRELCKPHTVIRISVPNLLRDKDGIKLWKTWPFDGSSPHFLAPFEHLHGFTPSSLAKLIKRSGFEPLPLKKIWPHYPVFLIRNLVGKVYSKAGQTMVLAKLTKLNLQK